MNKPKIAYLFYKTQNRKAFKAYLSTFNGVAMSYDMPSQEANWSEILKQKIKYLESSQQPRDRLDYASSIYECLVNLGDCINVWLACLTTPSFTEKLDQGSLERIYKFHRGHALSYIKNDSKVLKEVYHDQKPIDIFVKKNEKLIENIEKQNPVECLGYTEGSNRNIRYMVESINYYYSFLQNPILSKMADEKTYKEFYDFIKPFTLEFLKFDLEQTEKYEKENGVTKQLPVSKPPTNVYM